MSIKLINNVITAIKFENLAGFIANYFNCQHSQRLLFRLVGLI